MVSISVIKRKHKLADGTVRESETWYAQIRFNEKECPGGAAYLRDTGLASEAKAKKRAPALAAEIQEKELPLRFKARFSLEGMFSRWIEERGRYLRSGKDLSWQIKLLLAMMGKDTRIETIGNAAVNDFVQKAKEADKGEFTINRSLELLRSVLRYATLKWEAITQEHKIDWLAHFSKEPDEKVMYLSPTEARHFVEVLPHHIGLAFAFSYYTGCRLNEMETLIWERVDFEGRRAIVETKATGTRVKYRELRLSENALKVIWAVRGQTAPNGLDRVFDLKNRRKHWEKARKVVGREDIDWHGIRHSFGTEAGRQGQSDKMVGRLLGHAPGSRATNRYLHVMDDSMFAALEALPDIGVPILQAHPANSATQQNDNGQKNINVCGILSGARDRD